MLNPDDATRLAEQATLGALILDPAPLAEIRAWLRPLDFTEALHGQVYSVLCERYAAGQPTDALSMGTALIGRAPGMSHGVRVHDLLRAVPATVHTIAYARAVAETGLRREAAELGVLLRAGALQSALSRESVQMTSTCSLVDAGLMSIARRWDTASGNPHTHPDTTPMQLRAALRNPDLRRGADKFLQTRPERDTGAEHAHEALLVGSLISQPDEVLVIGARLPPPRISAPKWRTVYGAILELSELGLAVDLVTVAKATARLSHHGQPSPTMTQLREVVDQARLTSPQHIERLVWVDQMRRIADHGADQLLAGANNPGVRIGDLVDTGQRVTAALREAARMLPEQVADPQPRRLAAVPSVENVRSPVAR